MTLFLCEKQPCNEIAPRTYFYVAFRLVYFTSFTDYLCDASQIMTGQMTITSKIEEFSKTSAFDVRPLYMQVYDKLVSMIANGTWKPGEMIPNEIQLARDVGVSVGTMRKALQVMVDRALLSRHQGRGTYVADQEKRAETPYDNLRDARLAPLNWRVVKSEMSIGEADADEASALALRSGASVIRLRRVIVDDATGSTMLEYSTLPQHRFPGLTLEKGNQTLPIWMLARRSGVLLGVATENVQLFLTTTREAKSLNVEPGETVLQLTRIILSLENIPIEFRIAYCKLGKGTQYVSRTR